MFRAFAVLSAICFASNVHAVEAFKPLAQCVAVDEDFTIKIYQSTETATRALIIGEADGGHVLATSGKIQFGNDYPRVISKDFGIDVFLSDEDVVMTTATLNGVKFGVECRAGY